MPATSSSPVLPLPERVSLWALGAMLSLPFLVPIHTAPLPSFHSEWLACLLGLLAMPALFSRSRTIAFPKTGIALLALVAILLVQITTNRLAYAETGLLAALVLLWTMLIMTIAATLKDRLGLMPVAEHLAAWILAGALASAVLGLLAQLGHLHGWAIPATMGGNVAQKNNFANYLFVGLASALFLAQRQRLAFPAFIVAAVLLAQAAMISGSRSTLLYTGFLLFVSFFWKSSGHRKRMLVLSGAVLLGLLAAPYWPAVDPASLPDARVGRDTLVGTGDHIRVALYGLAWEMFQQAPWLGQGFGAFPSYTFFHADQTHVAGWVGMAEHPHNLFAQLLAEMGLLAAIAVALALVLWGRHVLKGRSNAALGWVAGLAGIPLIHAQLEYPLSYIFFLGILAVALGLGEERLRRLHVFRGILATTLAGSLLVSTLVIQDYHRLQRLAFQAARNTGSSAAREFADGILALRKGSLIKPYADWNLAMLMLPTSEHLPEKARTCQRFLGFNPIDHAAYNCAVVFRLAGRKDDFEKIWRLALRVYPEYLADYRKTIRSNLNEGQIKPLGFLIE